MPMTKGVAIEVSEYCTSGGPRLRPREPGKRGNERTQMFDWMSKKPVLQGPAS
jgi:hypothetical protein